MTNQIATTVTCAIRIDPATGNFLSPKGTLAFKLSGIGGSFNFVPLGCGVADSTGKAVALTTATIGKLVFSAAAAGTYTLTVQYGCTPGSTAQLTDDCTGSAFSLPLNDTLNGFVQYTIQVS
jgi:hypothetical protein